MKKAHKKLLKRMRLTPNEATEVARQFVRAEIGKDLKVLEPAKVSGGTKHRDRSRR